MMVTVTAAQLARARAILGTWPAPDAVSRLATLAAGIAAKRPTLVAIDERLSALRDWSARHPGFAFEHLAAAAAVAPLVEIAGQRQFDDRSFADLVDFAAQIPW